jgi:hypothetical protein
VIRLFERDSLPITRVDSRSQQYDAGVSDQREILTSIE